MTLRVSPWASSSGSKCGSSGRSPCQGPTPCVVSSAVGWAACSGSTDSEYWYRIGTSPKRSGPAPHNMLGPSKGVRVSRRNEIECWLTDMDGVLVHENSALPGAQELIQQWRDQGTPFLVLTNNSIYTPRDLAARLRASGLDVPEESIWTSALATADFLKSQAPGGSAYVIGEAGLTTALHEA